VVEPLDEFELIRRYFDRPAADHSVRVGVGDDGAVLVPDAGRELVTVIDTLVEEVHFPANLPPDAIGYRAVAVSLSDIAAMGARPRWMTLALTLDAAKEQWLQAFAAGLFAAAAEYKVSLVGGDTTRGTHNVISVQITGDVAAGASIRRTSAAAGDRIFVSGTFGDAAAGLSLLQDGDVSTNDKQYLADCFCRPAARVSLGQALTGVASAAIDISDGLYSDIGKLLDQSNAGGTIETDSIPLSPQLQNVCGDEAARQFALTGGDDYELCFTVAPIDAQKAVMLAEQCSVPLACIGEVEAKSGLRCTRAGTSFSFEHGGYRHF
jgi:thiamine-monophosphate kinase